MATHTSPNSAAQAAIEYCATINLENDTVQRRAWAEWLSVFPSIVQTLNSESEDSVWSVEPLIKIFGRMFFRGTLDNVGFEVVDLEDSFGATSHDQQGRIRIKIVRNHGTEEEDESVAIAVISTVLHECIHAYFMAVVCYDDLHPTGCRGKECGIKLSAQLADATYNRFQGGHGLAWHELAAIVEDCAGVTLGMKIRLGREMAARLHTRDTQEIFHPDDYAKLFPGRELNTWRDRDGRLHLILE